MAIGEITLTAVGNLTGEPELRFTQQGVAVTQFTVAVNPKEFDKAAGQWKDGSPSFVRVECWRNLAENVAESLTRGARVVVTGRWREEHWEKDGQKYSAWRLTADAVGADLTFATVKIAKTGRSTEAAPDDPWASASRTRPPAASSTPAPAASTPGRAADEPPF